MTKVNQKLLEKLVQEPTLTQSEAEAEAKAEAYAYDEKKPEPFENRKPLPRLKSPVIFV